MRLNWRGSTAIMLKAVYKNIINIIRFYPKMIYMSNHPDKYTPTQQYDYCIKLIHILIDSCNIDIEVSGIENLPAKDGFFVCSNHQEKFDPLAIWYSFPRQIGVVLNDEVIHRPFIREVCKLVRSQKLINSDLHSVVNSFNAITKDLNNGFNYMIFPEGEYETDCTKLLEFRLGCFKSPKRARCPIVPVAVIDSYRIFDRHFKTTKPLQVHYLKPIQPEEYENLSTKEIADVVKQKIQKAVDEFQICD